MHDSPLPSIISAELEASKGFLALLKEEESALVSGDIERLPALVQSKSEKVREIALLVQERNRLVPLSEIGGWLKNRPESAEPWQELTRIAEDIHAINETNGKMIETRLRSTQQALNMLQSLASTATNLYGPDGQSSIAASGTHRMESA